MSESEDETLLDKDEKPIPFFKQKETTKQKPGYSFGIVSFLGLVTTLILIASLTPFYSIVIQIIPPSIHKEILKPLYRNIPLYAHPKKFDEPMKIPLPEPGTLPVLDFDTGICFSFHSTNQKPNPDYIDAERLKAANRGTPIAEIIAIGARDKYEYQLKIPGYTETTDKDNKPISIICQKFGRTYGSIPENISALYIRPLKPFTAEKTVWNSTKHLYNDSSSPLRESDE